MLTLMGNSAEALVGLSVIRINHLVRRYDSTVRT